jgi:DNA topoisomerase-1
MLYNGNPVTLTPDQEEAASFYANTDPNGMHLGNDKTAAIYIRNFFTDFKLLLGKNHVIQKFELCDFKPIRDYLEDQKLVKKAITDDERKANKEVKEEINFKHGYALVDGHLVSAATSEAIKPARAQSKAPSLGAARARQPERSYFLRPM